MLSLTHSARALRLRSNAPQAGRHTAYRLLSRFSLNRDKLRAVERRGAPHVEPALAQKRAELRGGALAPAEAHPHVRVGRARRRPRVVNVDAALVVGGGDDAFEHEELGRHRSERHETRRRETGS